MRYLVIAFLALFSLSGCGGGDKNDVGHFIVTINILHAPGELFAGETAKLEAIATYNDSQQKDVTETAKWSSEDDAILTLEGSEVTAQNTGKTKILVEAEGFQSFANVIVHPKPSDLKIVENITTLTENRTVQLTAEFVHDDGTTVEAGHYVTWKSSDTNVAKVSFDGKVSGVKKGQATILAERGKYKAELALTVLPKITELTIQSNRTMVDVNDSLLMTLIATYSDQTKKDVTEKARWFSAQNQIAYFDSTTPNLLHGVNLGSVIVFAELEQQQQSIKITVEPELTPYIASDTKTQLTLKWPDKKADAYNIYWDNKPNITHDSPVVTHIVANEALDSPRTRTFSPLVEGTTYFFRIAAVYSGVESALGRELGFKVRKDGSWTSTRVLPRTATKYSVAGYNDSLYIFGGFGNDSDPKDPHSVLTSGFRYDIANNTWAPIKPMVVARHSSAAAVWNNKIYVFGGDTSPLKDNTISVTGAVEEYDPDLDIWTTRTNMPAARSDAVALTVNNKIYLIGGYPATTRLDVYDPATNRWSIATSVPKAVTGLMAASIDNRIYVFGGLNSAGDRLKTVHRYDTTTNTWNIDALTEMSPVRSHGSAVVINRQIYLVGGITVKDPANSVDIYHPETDHWTAGTNVEKAHYPTSAIVLDNVIYRLDGITSDATGDTYYPNIDVLN